MSLAMKRLRRADEDGRQGSHILVVEDDPLVLDLLRILLEEEGLDVETAANGREALARAAQRYPSLVLLDLNLPDARGEDVAAALAKLKGGPVPVLVVSIDSHRWERARKIGAFDHIRKPFDVEALAGSVHRALDSQEA